MMPTVSYEFRWDAKGRPVVVLDQGDGFAHVASEANLLGALAMIRSNRWKYASDEEWKAAQDIYHNALNFLHQQLELERR